MDNGLTSSRIEGLIHIPDSHKVAETLGWQPGIWGALFLAVACLFVFPGKGPSIALEWWISGASAALGLGLAGYEVWRRRNRTVLVREGGHVAVFRRARFDLTVAPDEISVEKADIVSMLKIGVPLGVCAALFGGVGIVGLLRDEAAKTDNLIIFCLGLACGASLASAAWTRFSCAHLGVPVRGSRWLAQETVMVHLSRFKELFSSSV